MRNYQKKLFFDSMPGRHKDLESWMEAMEDNNIEQIICLTGKEEIAEKSPSYAQWKEKSQPFTVQDLPIADFGIPQGDGAIDFWDWASEIAEDSLKDERPTFIHCGAGIGRTGMFAVAVLICAGKDYQEALKEIKETGSCPETADQINF
ncbi:MAG: protein-tyrosine phosphatase family protein, partial [Spirochaetaceae bacterium]|nr:protein-tyrosine phosphatase family protein [Spirochaetaceae bacterium]